jgi:hypothetical protein
MFKLYGMPIDWKATVQRSVTKSTTEAELMALSVAGAEMEWWERAFKSIKFELKFTPQLWCDNTATVGIITKREDRLQTKLCHVDTHQMWLRQEVEQKRIQVSWVPTDQMPTDSLIKILPCPKHECKRLDLCWPQWVHFGSQEHHRISWNPKESHGTSWNPMEGSGTWRNLLVADK